MMTDEFKPTTLVPAQGQFNWRDHLAVHPAAELFPLMSEAELRELADDIKQNGLQQPIVIWSNPANWSKPGQLIDGRNRLDALALLGWLVPKPKEGFAQPGTPPFTFPNRNKNRGFLPRDHFTDKFKILRLDDDNAVYRYVIAANLRRRHLTAEQKRDVIAEILKAMPEASNRQIASTVKVDHKTVGAVRSEMEGRGEIPHVEKRADTKGRKQPASKTVKVRLAGETLKSLDDFSDAAKQQIVDAIGAAKEPDTTAEESAADTAQDFWQRSLGNLAGDSISMEAFWKRQFGDWEKFEVTSDLVTLAEQAAEAWNKVAAKLKKAKAVKVAA